MRKDVYLENPTQGPPTYMLGIKALTINAYQVLGFHWAYVVLILLQSQFGMWKQWKFIHSVVSDSLQPHGLQSPFASVHGLLPARILEWLAISFPRGSSQPRDQTWISCIAGRFFTVWVTREAHFEMYLVLINEASYFPLRPDHLGVYTQLSNSTVWHSYQNCDFSIVNISFW